MKILTLQLFLVLWFTEEEEVKNMTIIVKSGMNGFSRKLEAGTNVLGLCAARHEFKNLLLCVFRA